jgi:hypothetical protein
MGLKKGQTNTKAGRPRGRPNKVTGDLRVWVNELLNDNRHQISKDIQRLEPYQRVMFFEKLLGYAVPKMQSVEAKIDLNRLSDEQIDLIINELNKNLDNE